MIRLLGKTSSINVRKVLWVCAELGLDCAQEDWGSGFQPLDTREYKALNPNALVPVIVDGDFVLWESNTILRYLANAYGPWLYPSPPRERARIDQWMDWQATDFNRSWTYALMGVARQSPAHADPKLIAESWTAWTCNVAILDGRLAETGAYVAGADFTLADIPIGLSLHRWRAMPLDHPDMPAANAYYERLSERPAFRQFTAVI